MQETLGDRIKRYESNFRYTLMGRGYTIIRLDGVGFSKYTGSLPKPFCKGLVDDMIEVTKYLCKNIQGVKLGYTQSDEITLVLTDFDSYGTQSWFDNQVQKMVSVASGKATSKFNQLRFKRAYELDPENFDASKIKLGEFDARVFQVPTRIEVNNVLIWRQRDFVRNSIASCAQSLYSPTQLHKKNTTDMQELIFQKGEELREKLIKCGFGDYIPLLKDNFNWNDLPSHMKKGTTVRLTEKEVISPKSPEPVIRRVWVDEPFEYSGDNIQYLPVPDNSKL